MTQTVTLELPDELVRQAKEAASHSGRPLETILTAWLQRGAIGEDTTLLTEGVEYPIFTPFGNEALAAQMLELLKEAEEADRKSDQDK